MIALATNLFVFKFLVNCNLQNAKWREENDLSINADVTDS